MSSLTFRSLKDLSPSLRRRATEYVEQTGATGTLLGACVGEISWDVRPVLEEGNVRTIVRFLGPFDKLPVEMAEKAQSYFMKIHTMTPTLQCGISEGTLWTKREYVPHTFAEKKTFQSYISKKGAKAFLLELIKLLRHLHERGIIHGHITAGNIYARTDGSLALLDHGAALFSPANYSHEDYSVLAPEISTSATPKPTTAVDVYSFGQFLKKLFPSLYLWHEAFFLTTLSERPSKRPSALEVQDYIFQAMRFMPVLWAKNLYHRIHKVLTTEIHFEKEKRNIPFYLALFLIAAVTFYYLFRPDYYVMWMSKDPSERMEVAEQAVFEANPRAREAVLEALLSGQGTEKILASFLQIAYSFPWSSSYSEYDASVLYGVALSEILPRVPPVPDFKNLSPGAVVVLVGALPVASAQSWYSTYLIEYFHQLPKPYDQPFIVLRDSGVQSLDNLALRALCKILYGEVTEEVLAIYFDKTLPESTFPERLAPLLPLLKKQPKSMTTVLEFFDKHSQAGKWIDSSVINNWKDKPAAIKLSLLAGEVPGESLTDEEVIDLLTLPIETRKAKLFREITGRLEDKTLMPVLAYLASERNKLNRNQTISLMLALKLKSKQGDALVDAWFDLKPDRDAVVSLLLARAQASDDSVNYFAVRAARYLDTKKWKPGVPELKALSRHTEPLVRALAYSRLRTRVPAEKEVLSEALKNEKDKNLKRLLSEKLK